MQGFIVYLNSETILDLCKEHISLKCKDPYYIF